jgi:predicted PurR-regulated permease PerM
MDRVYNFFSEKTPRRFVALAIFVGLIILFRHLLILMVFFVSFEKLIGVPAEWVARKTRMGRKLSIAGAALTLLGVVVAALALGIGKGYRAIMSIREVLPERIAAFRETPTYATIHEHIHDADRFLDGAKHYAANALGYLATFGHVLLYVTIGFILAVVYLLEEEELKGFAATVDPRSLLGTLIRWIGHVAEALLVTVQFQIVVAACNAVLTFPVLLLVGIRHPASLALMIFLSGMVPVVGNFVAGGILTFLAYQARGWLGVAIFTVLTFILHKLESYYLNPRLAARHVHLPGFVLIVSLLLWEHLLGFVGLFVSFPFLFVANRIRSELRAEDEPLVETGGE